METIFSFEICLCQKIYFCMRGSDLTLYLETLSYSSWVYFELEKDLFKTYVVNISAGLWGLDYHKQQLSDWKYGPFLLNF